MRLIAKADLPNGVKTGERFDVSDVQGHILLGIGVVRADTPQPQPPTPDRQPSSKPAEEDETESDPEKDDTVPSPSTATIQRRSPTYRRRDLTAEDVSGGDKR